MSPAAAAAHGDWTRVPISCVEDLSDAVYGAGLEATQMSRAPLMGSLAFAICDDITYSTGHLRGQVGLAGPLSQCMVTLGLGLELAPGTRHWLNEVATGDMGVFLPGDHHDALYMPGSLYAAVTLTAERLEEVAAALGLVLDAKALGGTGIATQKLPGQGLASLRAAFVDIHAGRHTRAISPVVLGQGLLRTFILHLGRVPRPYIGRADPRGYARIVARARDFIHDNLDQPLSIEKIASTVSTSQRTLHRAFRVVLNETPYSYVLKLRLHRVRNELISDAEMARTITCTANRWGINELGRFSGWYRDLFGERPSETLARYRRDAALPTEGPPARGRIRIVEARAQV